MATPSWLSCSFPRGAPSARASGRGPRPKRRARLALRMDGPALPWGHRPDLRSAASPTRPCGGGPGGGAVRMRARRRARGEGSRRRRGGRTRAAVLLDRLDRAFMIATCPNRAGACRQRTERPRSRAQKVVGDLLRRFRMVRAEKGRDPRCNNCTALAPREDCQIAIENCTALPPALASEKYCQI